jgi:hypothetical protein
VDDWAHPNAIVKANGEAILRVIGQPVARDGAASGADTGKRGLGLPLPNGAGTGPGGRGQLPEAATPGVSRLNGLQPGHPITPAWEGGVDASMP